MACSSWTPSSLSPDDLLAEPTGVRAPRTVADDAYDVSPWRGASRVRSGETLRAICRKYSIPGGFTPVLAGDRSPRARPPPGSICVFVDTLEAGMRLPLHPFFGAVLDHFGIAPGQLTPNGWRVLAGFVVLSHSAGAPPSLAVFRHFFSLCGFPHMLYSFRAKDAAGAGLLFLPMKSTNAGWKKEFFFLSSSAPWPCPVQWGKPFRSATSDPALTGEEKAVAANLLRARGGSPIDLTTYLHDSNMGAAKIIRAPSPPPPIPRGGLLNTPARITAWGAEVKSEPDCDVSPRVPSSSGKNKRELPEHRAKVESLASVYLSCPPGFSPHLRKARTTTTKTSKHGKGVGEQRHGDGDTSGWMAARQLLQGIVTPARQREHAASRPADVVASSYLSLLQTANEVAFSLDYALELEDRLREADAMRAELREVKAELAETKAAAAPRESMGSGNAKPTDGKATDVCYGSKARAN